MTRRASRAYLEVVLEHVREMLGSKYPAVARQLGARAGARASRLADAPNAAELAGLEQLDEDALDAMGEKDLRDLQKRARRWRRYVAAAGGEVEKFDALLGYIGARIPAVTKSAGRVVAYKEEGELGILTGIVMEPEVPDIKDGDVASAHEIALACYRFAIRYRKGTTSLGLQHQTKLDDEQAVLVENWCSPCDFNIGREFVAAGTWLQTWHLVDPELRAAAKDGTLTGFSIGATLVREALEQ